MDLAVIVLPKPFSNWLEDRYIPYDLRPNEPRDGVGAVIVCGWPESKNRFNPRLNRFDDKFGCRHIQTQAVLKEEAAFIDGNPEVHLLCEWTNIGISSTPKPGSRFRNSLA
jgi:hypothetical protein